MLVATDDMYEHVNLSGVKFVNILNATPELKDRCIVLNGVSKAYSMTGWRIGYAAGPEKIIKAMEILQSQSTSNPTSISQVAAAGRAGWRPVVHRRRWSKPSASAMRSWCAASTK